MSDALTDITENRLDAAPGNTYDQFDTAGKHRGSVADDDVEVVTGADMLADRVLEGGELAGTRSRHALSSTRSARRWRCQPWYPSMASFILARL